MNVYGDISTIRGDMKIAKNILFPQQSEDFEALTAYDINLAAYHSAQAIEKGVKLLIRHNELTAEKVSNEDIRHHNLGDLVLRLNRLDRSFIGKHSFIADNAMSLSGFNGLRYGEKGIGKKDAYILYKEARSFTQELENKFLKGKADISQETRESYAELPKLSVDVSQSKFNRKPNGGSKKKYSKHDER